MEGCWEQEAAIKSASEAFLGGGSGIRGGDVLGIQESSQAAQIGNLQSSRALRDKAAQ